MSPINGYSLKLVAIAACCLSLIAGKRTFGQVRRGEAAIGSWRDDKPGVRRLLTPQDMPAIAKPTEGVAEVVAMPAGAGPQVPDGFSAELVTTSGVHKPRVIRVAPNGDVFVADSMFGSVLRSLCAFGPRRLRRCTLPRRPPLGLSAAGGSFGFPAL